MFAGFAQKSLTPESVLKLSRIFYDDLGEDFVTGAISLAAETWDDASTTELFVTYTINYDAEINTVEPDFVNEIVFAKIAEDRVIAVCIVWYIKGGPPNQRGIIEFDIMFDDYDYTWGNAGETDEEGLELLRQLKFPFREPRPEADQESKA